MDEDLTRKYVQLTDKELYLIKQCYYLNCIVYAIGYLKLALVGCEELIKIKQSENSARNESTENIRKGWIIIPILYNIQHSLEIMVKFFSQYLLEDVNITKIEKSHDFKDLFDKLRKGIQNKNIKKPLSTELKISLDIFYINVNKYHRLSFLKNFLDISFIEFFDNNNSIFRYPLSKVDIVLSPFSLADKIDLNEIEMIKIDVENLEEHFGKIQTILQESKSPQQ